MGIRRQARESALQLLFAQDRTPLSETALAAFWDVSEAPEPARRYALDLANLVRAHQEELDQVIARYAENWTMDRMSRVDRNLLRLAVCEMFYVDDVPVRVTLDEAVEMAKAFGGEESGRFVNGILDRVAREEAARVTGGENLSTKVS
ncbi:MAG: transcription antitermination factor NusB [Nitrospirae bacterium]|nr:transcription antitermination factor NusB [Nitrospirota bacterium]